MSVCYFTPDFNKKYRCSYEFLDDTIEVTVDYEICDEVEPVNGVRMLGSHTAYKKRDILIVDYDGRKNYLLKNAYYAGNTSVFRTPDGGSRTRFRSSVYFEHVDLEKLCNLPDTPKVTRIKIFSNAINELIGYPSLTIERRDEEQTIHLSRECDGERIAVDQNGIRNIVVADDWRAEHNSKEYHMIIHFNGYIEIELAGRVNYDRVHDFVSELKVFMQLYFPDKFVINKISVMMDGEYYKLSLPERKIQYKERYTEPSVKGSLLDFLKRCYTAIPYRNSKAEIRNIPYIILNTSRSIEDNFLMFYRFIECYYKKQPIPNIKKTFISYSIKEHYIKKHELSEEQLESFAQEIVSLRNHYVHAGYYMKNPEIDVHWIYERTKILYDIVIDIIFTRMLGYEEYQFCRHF